MTEPHNPYRPPTSFVQDAAAPSVGDGGNLEDALAGRIHLDPMAAARQAWEAVSGTKLTVFAASVVLSIPAVLAGLVILAIFIWPAIVEEGLSDPVALAERVEALALGPTYILVAGLIAAPTNAFMYLGYWKLGLRRAGGAPLDLRDAFALECLVPGSLFFLLLVPLNFLNLVHQALGLLALVFWFVGIWALPMIVDRGAGVGEAVATSVRLTGRNVLPMLGVVLILIVGGLASLLTCGVGLLWFGPFACHLGGFCWKQLAGLDRMA